MEYAPDGDIRKIIQKAQQAKKAPPEDLVGHGFNGICCRVGVGGLTPEKAFLYDAPHRCSSWLNKNCKFILLRLLCMPNKEHLVVSTNEELKK
eukprot:891007-Pelagomonas_calceolata.AAC.2